MGGFTRDSMRVKIVPITILKYGGIGSCCVSAFRCSTLAIQLANLLRDVGEHSPVLLHPAKES
jgi:hypothetical protein